MEAYLIYIGKAGMAAAAFYLAFLILFQNQKQFVFNRLYLPVSFALSFVIPLITFTSIKYVEAVPVSDFNGFAYLPGSALAVEQAPFVPAWYHYLFALYVLGSVLFLFRLITGHLKALSMVVKSQIQKLFGIEVHVTPADVHPFSFFSKIVVSEKTLGSPNLKMIVEHESIHVREKHTLDILFAEILFLAQWFNPFAWLLKDAVNNNLEYLTDDQIAQNHNPKEYQLAMVALADKKGVAPFLNALNGSQLKNRIIMMKKKTENKYALLKQLVVLPLLAVLVMGLSNKEVKTEIISQESGIEFSRDEKIVTGTVTNEKGEPIKGASVVIKGRPMGVVSDENGKYEIEVLPSDKVLLFRFLDYDEVSAQIGNKNNIDAQIKTDGNPAISGIPFDSSFRMRNSKGELVKPLYMIGDKEINIENIDHNLIKYFVMLNDEEATEKYGEKGKNGVIVISTTTAIDDISATSEKEFTVSGKVTDDKGQPLSGVSILIKGKTLETTTTDTKGNYEIKSESEIELLVFGKDGFETLEVKPGGRKNIDVKLEVDNKLYIVDGKEHKAETSEIDTDNIERIDILKGESGFKFYGEKGKNGVVIISTKDTVQSKEINTTVITTQAKQEKENGSPVFYKVEQMPEFPGGELGLRTFIARSIKYPEIAAENGIQGKVYVTFVIAKNGDVKNPTIAQGVDPALDKEALRVVSSLPKWRPGREKGEAVNVSYTVPITFQLQEQASSKGVLRSKIPGGSPLYIVNGVEKESLEDLNPQDIESIDVLKDKSATEKYGDRGRNGVIIIDTKAKKKFDATDKILIVDGKEYRGDINDIDVNDISSVEVKKSQSNNNIYDLKRSGKDKIIIQTKTKYNTEEKPLIIIDGKETNQAIKDIDPETIHSINVLKDKLATEKYGEKGKNGVILITLKAAKENPKITSLLEFRKFIANEIVYPKEAVETNTHGAVSFFFRVDKNGNIFDIKVPKRGDLSLDEVVVVGYKTKIPGRDIKNSDWMILTNEVERVLKAAPALHVPEFYEKSIKINVKFELQD